MLSLKHHLAIHSVRDPLLLSVIPCSDCYHAPYFSFLIDLDSSEDDDDNENGIIQKEVARMLVLKHRFGCSVSQTKQLRSFEIVTLSWHPEFPLVDDSEPFFKIHFAHNMCCR